MRNMKYFIVFALILFIALGYKTYDQYKRIHETEKLIILNESQALSNFVFAFRETYQNIFIKNNIEVNDKTIHLLPVKTILEISQRFSKSVKGDIVIRTVSDRPRNIKNKANSFEIDMIQYFQNNPEKKEKFLQKENIYSYTKPLYIKESCLKCHGKRETAIPSVRDRYENAYDYKVGDIRGLLNIEIKENSFFEILYRDFIDTLLITLLVYVILLFIIYLLLQKIHLQEQNYTKTLEDELSKKTFEIQKQKDTFETLFEKSSDGILILKNNYFVQCNEKAVEMMKCTSKKCFLTIHPSDLSPEYQPDGELSFEKANKMIDLSLKQGRNEFEWVHKRLSGEEFWVEVNLTPIILNNEQVIYVTWRDISERKDVQKKLIEQTEVLYHRAHHDDLTGLANRTLFNEQLQKSIKKAKETKTYMAVLFIDLDQFKQINDSLGHEIGDSVLKIIAKRLKAKIRKDDFLARLGGDEFIIIIDNYKTLQGVSILAQKILDVVVQPINIHGQVLYLSSSIGISLYPQDDNNGVNLLKYADSAMYKAKDEGRNNFQFYHSDMTELAFKRIMMKSDIRKALDNEEFIVYYQPQINAHNNELIGMEALVRWNHPKMGLISPDKFIPLAEECNLMIEIDHWVMETAMLQIAQWYKKGKNPKNLSLNLTLNHLRSNNFIETLQKCMSKIHFLPNWLELEITESEVMKKHEEAIKKLQELSDIGISIAIDDFGTGYSSLSHLKRLPINKLKIDRSFIEDVPKNKDDTAIVKAIIALAQNLNLQIIAEGVETLEQKEFLLKHNCTYIQGYYYAKPMSSSDIEEKFLTKK